MVYSNGVDRTREPVKVRYSIQQSLFLLRQEQDLLENPKDYLTPYGCGSIIDIQYSTSSSLTIYWAYSRDALRAICAVHKEKLKTANKNLPFVLIGVNKSYVSEDDKISQEELEQSKNNMQILS